MEPRLVPINAVIALTTGDGGWPRPLLEAGYQLHGIEVKLLPAAKQKVVVDVVLADDGSGTVLLTECKSGANLRQPQMRNYGLVTPTIVARQLGASFAVRNALVLIACLEANEARIRTGLASMGIDVPLLLIGDRSARLPDPVGTIAPFHITVPGPPPRIIALDDQSSDEEFIRFLLPHVVAAAAGGRSVVGVDELLGKVIPWWSLYHHEGGQDVLGRRATGALTSAFAEHFAKDFRIEPRSGQACGVVRILRSPATNSPRGVTQGWQRLRRQGEKSLGRRMAPSTSPGQMDLFSAELLGLGAETGEQG